MHYYYEDGNNVPYNRVTVMGDRSYSSFHGLEDLTTYPVAEPVSVTELKNYLRLDGHAGTDTTEDALLASIISEARGRLESVSWTSLVQHLYKVHFTSNGSYKLPYSVNTVSAVTDADGTAFTNYEVKGGVFTTSGEYYVTYTTNPLPIEKTKMSVMRLAAYLYQNRGDEDESLITKKALDLSKHYSQKEYIY